MYEDGHLDIMANECNMQKNNSSKVGQIVPILNFVAIDAFS